MATIKIVKSSATGGAKPPAAPVRTAVLKFAEFSERPVVSTRAAIASQAAEPEDEYRHLYLGQEATIGAIQPPFDLRRLEALCSENNALGPCIEAMVTNVDGTGFDIVKDAPAAKDPDTDVSDPKVAQAWDFFSEPWPGESFVTQRKRLRRDIKRTGNGYLEVIRSAKGTIVFTKNVDSKMMRIIQLGQAVPTKVTVQRGGEDVTVTMNYRWRRYVQKVNGIDLTWFKEFGCPLDLNKNTGQWAPAGESLPVGLRATEIIHFIDVPDAYTPYGLPCWISQMPSVLGSRKAEELNLDFFDNGGVPPIMIILSGGTMSNETRVAIEQRAALGSAKSKNKPVVIEMEPTGGTIESAAPAAKVQVERFGAEKQNDSMFEKYDDKCETRVRRAFRLAPIFIGHASDYSFATAFASYTVGEAQTFRPERDEFDEIISVKFMPALGFSGYRMKSRPLNIEDATLKLQGIEIAQTTMQVDASEVLDAVNETVGTTMKVSKTIPHPSTYIQGPAIKAVPGGSQAAPGGKAGITIPQQGQVPKTGTGNTVAKKPAATPAKSPAVRKSEAEISDLVVSALEVIKSGDYARLGTVLADMSALDGEDIDEMLSQFEDLGGAAPEVPAGDDD